MKGGREGEEAANAAVNVASVVAEAVQAVSSGGEGEESAKAAVDVANAVVRAVQAVKSGREGEEAVKSAVDVVTAVVGAVRGMIENKNYYRYCSAPIIKRSPRLMEKNYH